MKKDLTDFFIAEIFKKPHKKVYENNKSIIKTIDDTWSMVTKVLKGYASENNRG